MLVDCGEGTQILLRRKKVNLQKIEHIFISHLHGDHYFGLVGLISSLNLLGKTTDLTVFAPPQLEEIVRLQLDVSETILRFNLKFIPTESRELSLLFETKSFEVYSFPVLHRIPTTGFLFKEKPKLRNISKEALQNVSIPISEMKNLKKGLDICIDGKLYKNDLLTISPTPPKSYAYTADTAYCEGIIPFVKNVNLLYHETTFTSERLEDAQNKFHSTALQAATIAKKADVEKLIIGHFSARYDNLNVFLNEARSVFENTEIAAEGETFYV